MRNIKLVFTISCALFKHDLNSLHNYNYYSNKIDHLRYSMAELPDKYEIEVGPLWNNDHAQQVIAEWREKNADHTHEPNGHWWTTVPGSMSVIQL